MREPVATYLRWNDRLAAHFFGPEMAGHQVYLFATGTLISDLGSSFGASAEDFFATVKQGPPWTTREGLCQKALQALHEWRRKSLPYPPYIAYLALFVLAAGTEGEFAPHAYYPRLRHLLGYPEGSMLPSYERMLELWDDLEQWSTVDKRGELGIFKARIVGNWIHVGLPIAQTILTEHDRKALPQIFTQAGLDPTFRISTEELVKALRTHGAGILGARALRLLETHIDEELFKVLLDTIAEELSEWDGQLDEPASAAASAPRVQAVMRLCLSDVDLVARQVRSTLRFKLNREFPEGRLILASSDTPSQFWSEESVAQGWSNHLHNVGADIPADAAEFDWVDGLTLRDERLGWQFRFPGRSVRVLVNGMEEGLPGLIEVHMLPSSQPFFLVYEESAWPQLADWSREQCRGFVEQVVTRGLPPRWRLATVAEAIDDTNVRNRFPSLSLPRDVRLRFAGGIRSSAGNNFFSFAPPELHLEGGDGHEQVLCAGELLVPIPGMHFYRLPSPLPIETRITVEVKHGEESIIRQSLYLTSNFVWRWSAPLQEFDQWGVSVNDPSSSRIRAAGAVILGETPDVSGFRLAVFLTTGLKAAPNDRIFLVGRRPGQIRCLPSDPLPEDWDPVWAIPFQRRGYAIYCGGDPGDSGVKPTPTVDDRHLVSLWKKILWYQRKRVIPPGQSTLLRLWRQYQEVARNV